MACEAEAETLAKQMKSELPASPEIPKKLMRVIWKATEKEQSKRFQTALEFKEAIKESFFPDPTLTERILQWFKDRFNL
jgi:serine/threonine-protein kinase